MRELPAFAYVQTNVDKRNKFRKINSVQHVLKSLTIRKSSIYSILIFVISLFGCPGPSPRPLHATGLHWSCFAVNDSGTGRICLQLIITSKFLHTYLFDVSGHDIAPLAFHPYCNEHVRATPSHVWPTGYALLLFHYFSFTHEFSPSLWINEINFSPTKNVNLFTNMKTHSLRLYCQAKMINTI